MHCHDTNGHNKFVLPQVSTEHRDALDHMLASRDQHTEISTTETIFQEV